MTGRHSDGYGGLCLDERRRGRYAEENKSGYPSSRQPSCHEWEDLRAYFKGFQVVGHIGGEKGGVWWGGGGWSWGRENFLIFSIKKMGGEKWQAQRARSCDC